VTEHAVSGRHSAAPASGSRTGLSRHAGGGPSARLTRHAGGGPWAWFTRHADGGPGAWFTRYWHWVLLSLWTVAWSIDMAGGGGIAWVFVRSGTAALFGEPGSFRAPGGLHLYANNPDLQIGPLSFAVAEVLRHVGPDSGITVTEVLLTAAGPAVILLGVGARIALDPGVHGYYTAGVLVGAMIWDTIGARRPWPLWSLLSILALSGVPVVTRDPQILGDMRLAIVLAFTTVLLLCPASWVRQTGHGPWPRTSGPVRFRSVTKDWPAGRAHPGASPAGAGTRPGNADG